ncbi:UbiH/UbiF family hydroxylase [Pseudoponticoccus marisrubri]|nr:UbiH/UbiF family hydroxylase [Pseudoponticoccus marisrubri]
MDTDILVAGGGIAGMTAAAGFAQAGFRTICVDPGPPPAADAAAEGADLRTTAFLQSARDFLDEIGLWPRLDAHATPLQVMRIVESGAEERVAREFDAEDISDRPFGWNLPNWLMKRELAARLDGLADVTFLQGVGVARVLTRETEARVGLSDGRSVRCRLVVAADGRDSPVRQAAGIEVSTTRFGQKALAFAVTHPIPHENVSTEIHRSGGPFTLVPLPDRDGRPCSAIVWMEHGPEAERLAALPVEAFEAEMTERSGALFGPLKLVSRRSVWPIIAQQARRLSGTRVALVAEAAHVVPPIGAQGLNMSLRDIATLRDLAIARPEGLGDRAMLDAYHRARITDIRVRVAGITALNRISQVSAAPLREIRARGLDSLYSLKPVRTGLMKLGLGAGG